MQVGGSESGTKDENGSNLRQTLLLLESEANLELAQFRGKLGNAFIRATFPQFAMSSTFPAPSFNLF